MALIYPEATGSGSFTSGSTAPGWQPENFLYGAHFVVGSAGTVTQMGVYADWGGNAGNIAIKFGLYTSGGSLIGQSTGTITSGTKAWRDSGAVSLSIPSAGTYYVLVSAADADASYGYSNTFDGSFATEAYATAMQSSETITGEGDAGIGYGVRMDFTATAGGAISGSSANTITPTGALTGSGALAGSAANVFGAGSSTLRGTGALAGSSANIFGAGASALTGSGALSGSAANVFSNSATLTGSGALAGAVALLFGATLSRAGDITGSAALTFSSTAVLAGTGALSGAADVVFGQSAALTGSGALAGTGAIVFTNAGDLTGIAAGDISGSAALTFSSTGALTGAGELTGVAALIFGGTASIPSAASPRRVTGFARPRRNYIYKGKRYYLTNEELCALIRRDQIDITREDIKVSYKGKKPHPVSKNAWAELQETMKRLSENTPEPIDDDDEIEAIIALL